MNGSSLLPPDHQPTINLLLFQFIDLGQSECRKDGEVGDGQKGNGGGNLANEKEGTCCSKRKAWGPT